MEAEGALQVHGSDYVKYRGGKQSIGRQVHNVELLLVADRNRRGSPRQREAVRRFLLEHRLRLLLRSAFRPEALARTFPPLDGGGGIRVRLGSREVLLALEQGCRFTAEAAGELAAAAEAGEVPAAELEALQRALAACACADREEEIHILLGVLERETDARERRSLERRILWLLRKLAHRKYRQRFETLAGMLRMRLAPEPERYPTLLDGLPAIELRAAARFAG
jgi:hypothetical protein